MRTRTGWSTIVLLALLLWGCSSPAQSPSAVVSEKIPAEVTATSQPPTATTVPPTATSEPTAVPTAIPTIEPTAVPIAPTPATPQEGVVPVAPAADTNDVPHLDESAAGTQPHDQQVSAVSPAQPVRIQIPAIKLDYKPVSVGLDKNRIPIVPKHDVGWYNLSAMPGQGENVVFWGHVLRFRNRPNIPAPFARVKELQPGAEIIVTTATGQQARYQVTQSLQVTPDQVRYILPTGKEQVTLVSCIGDNVIVQGSVTKKYRLITIADRVQ